MVTFISTPDFAKQKQHFETPFLKAGEPAGKDRQRQSDPMISLTRPEVRVLICKLPKTAISAAMTGIRKTIDRSRFKKKKKKIQAERPKPSLNSQIQKKGELEFLFPAIKKAQKWPQDEVLTRRPPPSQCLSYEDKHCKHFKIAF